MTAACSVVASAVYKNVVYNLEYSQVAFGIKCIGGNGTCNGRPSDIDGIEIVIPCTIII